MSTTVSGRALTYNLPNFVGELFNLTPADTPFKNLAARNGVRRVASKVFSWQTVDNPAPAQPEIVEGADPVYEERTRVEVHNVTQIFQYGVDISYTKLATYQQVADDATPWLGPQPVTNELEFQQALKLDRCSEDMEVSFLTGTFQNPSDNTAGRRTRGILTAVTSNVVDASGATLGKEHIDELLRKMAGNRARFLRPVIFGNAYQVQQINELYGFAPESRDVGGINIEVIINPLVGRMGVVYNRHMPADTLLIADMAFPRPVVTPIPGKGELFLEPKPATGASVRSMLYGEWGLEYGPEQYHGKITGLDTGE